MIDQLSEPQRTIDRMKLDGMSQREIARALGVSDATMSRMLQLLKDRIVSGKAPYSERQYRNRMERIMKNINLHGATAHVLRHTFCTMAAGHTDIKTLQTMAGHSKISMTMDRYTHGLDSRVQSQSENLSGMYNSMN